MPAWLVQSVQYCGRSCQSATHSPALPTIPNAPQLDLQFARDPVGTGPVAFVLQSFGPGVPPGSGVPAAAPCHSMFVRSRFPDSRHAWFAWNHVMQVLGPTPGTETG